MANSPEWNDATIIAGVAGQTFTGTGTLAIPRPLTSGAVAGRTTTLLPDTKLAAITWVRTHPDLPVGVSVGGGVPDDLTGLLPWVACFRPPSPAPMLPTRWDRAALNWQIWAPTEQDAHDTAVAVQAILHAAPGHTTAGTVIQAVTDMGGLGQVHDSGYPDLSRQTFTVIMTARNA